MEGHPAGAVDGASPATGIGEPQSLDLAEWQPIRPDILAQPRLPRRVKRLSAKIRHPLALPSAAPWGAVVIGFAHSSSRIPSDRILRACLRREQDPRPIPYARLERRAQPRPVASDASPDKRLVWRLRIKAGLLKLTALVAVSIAWALFYMTMKAMLGPKQGMAASPATWEITKKAAR